MSDRRLASRRPAGALELVWRWWTQPSTLAISFHRVGRSWFFVRSRIVRLTLSVAYRLLYPVVEAWSGVTLPREAKVGAGLRIFHRGKVVVNPAVVIGSNCSIVHGVTIGNRRPGGPCPIIGDNVSIGAYAQILGGVHVGDNVKIGSLALVIEDIPSGSVVAAPKAVLLDRYP